MIRTAVIGLTNAGIEHARASAADPLAALVGVCDADSDRAATVATELGTAAFDSIDALIDARPALAVVRSPLPEREEHIRRLLGARIHVLTALPAAEPDRLLRLEETARTNGLVLAGDFHLRFTPAMDKALAWITEGAIGTPLFINVNLFSGAPEDGPDLFRNLGAHGIDMMTALCGPVAEVQCFGAKAPGRSAWSSAQVNLRFANDVVGTLTLSADMTQRHPWARCELAGSRARLTIENVYEETTLFVHADEEKRVVTNSIFGGIPQMKETYGRRFHRLLEQIHENTPPENIDGGLDHILAAAHVMDAARDAAERDATIRIAAP